MRKLFIITEPKTKKRPRLTYNYALVRNGRLKHSSRQYYSRKVDCNDSARTVEPYEIVYATRKEFNEAFG